MKPVFRSLFDYGKMVKLSHTLFALPFAAFSAVLAIGSLEKPPGNLLILLGLILICMVSARSAAMGFNRYVDREFDKKNPRTAMREIPSGTISEKSVLLFVILSSVIFIVSTFFINKTCFLLSFPALAAILFYSYSKRFTFFCHIILGFGIGIAPLGAWLAITENISLIPFLLFFGLLFHISGFDILYSTQDREIDISLGLHSIPVKFGIRNSFLISRMFHIAAFLFFISAGIYAELGIIYFGFVSVTGVLLIIEHRLISPDNLQKLPIAFFHINASISVFLFIGVIIDRWSFLISKLGIMPA
ncbi:MAG: putative 4-hydroxybenzoate polyprenyltransferase [Leptospira sp.]|nr:putative 4-hydroxybenzoate polyprenyltransferase [Leptospira sp.]